MNFKEDLVWKDSFFTGNFSVDHCLSKYTQKSDLETLRRELKHYGSELQQQMSEILKTETEAIVNLAEYLTNLNSKIEDLSVPICQLREEIRSLYELIHTAETDFETMLNGIKHNNTQYNHINLKLGIISSSLYIDKMIKSTASDSFDDLITLERVINKYSFQRNYLDELGIMSLETENTVKDVEIKLIEMVNIRFLNAVKSNDRDVIAKCLRMYDNLGKQNEAQTTYQIQIVRPALSPMFSERNLEKHNNDINKIYADALKFMDNKMNVLLEILDANPDLKSYNFILKSFWTEFDKQSREGLPYVTAPGNPELFQKRFTSTWQLMLKIARKCGDENLVRQNSTFQNHIKRFNLPVYFEIRFQQIAGNFETDIFIKPHENMYAANNELSCKLKVTLAFWKAVSRCFHPDVFINHLADQFLKFFLLLLSRYLKWFENTVKEYSLKSEEALDNVVINSLIDLGIVTNLIAIDTDDVKSVDTTVFATIPAEMKPVIMKVFKSNRKLINNVSKKLQDHLINQKAKESLMQFRNVGAIPRLYRRTNRGPPKEPSTYMTEGVKPILLLHNKFQLVVKDQLDLILDNVITKITMQYLSLVQEVLSSVCKTEESLRRLKSRNLAASDESASQSDTMSDEMKIREQIRFDVAYFLEKLYQLGSTASRKAMDTLKLEINK